MNGLRTETPHYTREQVAEHLRDTLELLEAAEVPIEIAPAAFTIVFEKLAAKAIQIEHVQAPPAGIARLGV